MESCDRVLTGFSTLRHASRPIANRPQDSILPHFVLTVLAAALASSCGHYADFSLPPPEASGPAGPFQWEAQPLPVLARGGNGDWDSTDVLNPSVIRWKNGYLNLYSGFDGNDLAHRSRGIFGRGGMDQAWQSSFTRRLGRQTHRGERLGIGVPGGAPVLVSGRRASAHCAGPFARWRELDSGGRKLWCRWGLGEALMRWALRTRT